MGTFTFIATILTFCFADSSLKNACNYRADIPKEVGTQEIVYVPRSALTPEALESFLCSKLSARTDDFLLIHFAGKGNKSSETWNMDWLDEQGTSRGAVSPYFEVIGRAVEKCATNVNAKNLMVVHDGCALGGTCFRPKRGDFRLVGNGVTNVPDNNLRAMSLVDGLRYEIEKASAEYAKGNPDPWNQDVNDIAFLPDSPKAMEGCGGFWVAMLEIDLVTLLRQRPTTLPNPGRCGPIPKPIEENHAGYLRGCKKFFVKESKRNSDEESGCRSSFVYYRAELKQWATRDKKVSEIDDPTTLAEKIVWANSPSPAGKQRDRIEQEAAYRLVELRPQNVYVAASALKAAISTAIQLTEKKVEGPALVEAWQRAEKYSDIVLAMPLQPELDGIRQMGWYGKTWGMETARLKKLVPTLRKEPALAETADYLAAYVEHSSGNEQMATAMLRNLLARNPANEEAREALSGSWRGFTVSSSQGHVTFLDEALK